MDFLCWTFLGIALIIGTFGIPAFFTLVLSLVIIIVGSLTTLRWLFLSESEQWWICIHQSRLSLPKPSLKKVEDCAPVSEVEGKIDRRITGSSLIDDQLQIVIKYFLRDFTIPWYSQISSNSKFVTLLHLRLQECLVSISNRCKTTDWVGYLTTRLVDDVASHLRLFRESKASFKTMKDSPSKTLIDHFFDKEAEKEKDVCRDNICLKEDSEKDYLSDLVEIVLYLTIPPDEFANTPVRTAVVEVIVSSLLLPLINRVSDPDYVNTLIVWACTDIPITSELFLSVIKSTVDTPELDSVRKAVVAEMNQLRSRDSGCREEGTEVKQRIGSLKYLRQIIDARINRLDKGPETDSMGLEPNFSCQQISRANLLQLPIEVILKNNLSLHHFINYMSSINCQHYVNLYLNIEGWKTAVSERLCALELERIKQCQQEKDSSSMPGMCVDHFSHDLSAHKSEADVMYEQYLSEKAQPRVHIDDSIVKRLILRLRSEKLNDNWFDETQDALFNTLKETDLFYPAFKRSMWYIRLLAELDFLKDISRPDEDDAQSLDDGEDMSDPSLQNESRGSSRTHSPLSSFNPSPNHTRNPSFTSRPYILTANITGTEIVREGNSKSHALYRLSVLRKDDAGREELWHVSRRYSEFYDFHISISSKFMDLASMSFPSKKILNNLATWFLEKRTRELNEWLDKILMPPTLQSHPGMQDMVLRFLDHTPYQSAQMQQGNIAKRVEENFVAPIRVGVKSVSSAVKAVPDTVLNTVDGVVDGLYKKFMKNNPTSRYSAHNNPDCSQKGSIDLESEENIPLRILLLLMDEVFDLRSKDQWFRRRIILFLRQILKAMFGDIVNRRIVEYVEYITSPDQMTHYVKIFKESIWPNGTFAPPELSREEEIALRTKLAARTCMLASISDEFKAILGSQTSSRGILNVYDCVQWKPINKRLLYVLLNGLLEAVFSSHIQIPILLRTLSTRSSRLSTRNAPNNSRWIGKISVS